MDAETNLAVLHNEIDWLQSVIDQVICSYLLQEGHEKRWQDLALPDVDSDSPYGQLILRYELDSYARIMMALALAPHLRPEALDIFFGKNQIYDRGFSEFGGVVDKAHSGFLPTGQTLCFLISATEPALRLQVMQLLSKESALVKEQIISLSEAGPSLPPLSGLLCIAHRWLHYFITGEQLQEEHSASFPAQKISTVLNWEDIVLDDLVMEQVNEICTWLEHGHTLMSDWGLSGKIRPGYRAMFYGPPGTGKTLTATLLGKVTGRDVYKVDLSMVVSKYIGETEKNLSKVFDTAQHKNWILFFDEADALFGKRTAAATSNDRHANEQTAYLLQRIEDFPGTIILASNLRSNMDEAFTRRFQSMIHFSMPSAEERYILWKNAFAGVCDLHEDIDLYSIAEAYELAGGAIINVLRYCAMMAIRRKEQIVTRQDLLTGIRREFKKENRTLTITA